MTIKDTEYQLAVEKGVSSPYAQGFMPYTADANGTIHTDYAKTARVLAQDSAMTTAGNVGIPDAYLRYLDPSIMGILFGVQASTKMFDEKKIGDWTTKTMQFPLEEYVGDVTPYGDFTDSVSSDVNYEFPERQNFLFQTAIKYGNLETDIASQAKISLVASKQKAAAFVISTFQNKAYLYGVAGKKIYGMLNDPNLNPAISPISVGGNSTWEAKVSADQNNTATIVFNDINKLFIELCAKNGGNIQTDEKIRLAISNARYGYLTQPNQYGKTALEMLKENFPNIEVIQIPQLSTSAGEMLYMTVPSFGGFATAENAYSEKMRMTRVEVHTTYDLSKAVAGTYGCVIKRPSLCARMVGV